MLDWFGICWPSSVLVRCCDNNIARFQRCLNMYKSTKFTRLGTKLRRNTVRCDKFHWNDNWFHNTNGCRSLYPRACKWFNFRSQSNRFEFHTNNMRLIESLNFPQNTLEDWSIIFIIAAIAYIIPAIVFILFGNGNVQPWNEPKKTDEKTADDIVPQA